jgi:undecaprenyl-diphosphatase
MSGRKLTIILVGLFLLWLAMLSLGGAGATADRLVLDAFRSDALTLPARWLTLLGSWPATTLISISAASWLALRRDRRRALLLLVVTFSGRLMVEAQKIAFARLRPDGEGHLVAVHTYSFPSAHAANSMLVWLALALIAVPRRGRRAAAICAILLSLSIGLTRLVLDVHWPSDVVGGWAFGAGWALLMVRLAGERLAPERH